MLNVYNILGFNICEQQHWCNASAEWWIGLLFLNLKDIAGCLQKDTLTGGRHIYIWIQTVFPDSSIHYQNIWHIPKLFGALLLIQYVF